MKNKVTLIAPILFQNKYRGIEIELKSGLSYLFNDDMLKVLKRIHKNKLGKIETVDWVTPKSITQAKNILLYRPGGIGDILFILPYLKSIKNVNPNCKITFCTTKENTGLLNISNYIDNTLADPIEYSSIIRENFDKIIIFNKFIEDNPEAEKINAYDLASKYFDGLERCGFDTKRKVNKPTGDKIHLGIGFKASSKIRDLSPALWFSFLKDLDYKKYRATIVAPPEVEKDVDQLIKSVLTFNHELKIDMLIKKSITEVMDSNFEDDPIHIGIGPDSGLVNLWGYHNIPVIGIFGPFDSKLRLKYYKNAIGIDMITTCPFGVNEDGSCFEHSVRSCSLAQFRNELFAPCIHLLSSDYIINAAEFLVKKLYINEEIN